MIEIHAHIFDENCVPEKFIGNKFLQKLVNKFTLPLFLIMDNLNPFTDNDALSRYAHFINNENKSQAENLKELKTYYPEGTKIVILSVNMAGMGAGKVKKNIEEQLKELIYLKNIGEPILIFYHLDPTTENCLEILYKYQDYIDGLKVYTLMGHSPLNMNLLEGYEWAQTHNKPVIFHTSPDSPVYFKGSKKELRKRLDMLPMPLYNTKNDNHSLCRNFTNPFYYHKICDNYPKLKVCFAHLGGEAEIRKTMRGEYSMASELLHICKIKDNAYFDTSSSFYSDDVQKWLRLIMKDENLRRKVLFGTDFYMCKTTCQMTDYTKKMLENIGMMNFDIISIYNPSKFLA